MGTGERYVKAIAECAYSEGSSKDCALTLVAYDAKGGKLIPVSGRVVVCTQHAKAWLAFAMGREYRVEKVPL